jgi:hypothetical protein
MGSFPEIRGTVVELKPRLRASEEAADLERCHEILLAASNTEIDRLSTDRRFRDLHQPPPITAHSRPIEASQPGLLALRR